MSLRVLKVLSLLNSSDVILTFIYTLCWTDTVVSMHVVINILVVKYQQVLYWGTGLSQVLTVFNIF